MKRNKKGFVTVYICIFFVSLVTMTVLFTQAAKEGASYSAIRSLGRLWGQSVLAEYDLNLQQRYNLFGYYGTPADIKKKLNFYLEASQGYLLDERTVIENCTLYTYSLRNTDIFRKQIVETGKLITTDIQEPQKKDISATKDHVGNSKTLLDELPSADTKTSFSLDGLYHTLKGISGVGDIFQKGSDRWFETVYLFARFKHKCNEAAIGESYFQQEVEYVLCGKKSDEANARATKNKIVGLREIMNLAYLNGNEASKSAALAAAELLTPGPTAVVTQQTLLSLWAYAESINDYNLLMEGYPVPLRKNVASWAVDLDSVLADHKTEKCIYTGYSEGETYEGYLKLLLTSVSEDVLLLRMMDLIQINMRYFYYDGFRIEDYYAGLTFSFDISEEVRKVEITY